jgi:hypothetical protein
MKSTFKEKFDKYELLITPLLLILVLLLIIYFMPQIVVIENFSIIFVLPFLVGMIFGLILYYLLDKYWKKVSFSNVSEFLKMPTLLLILLSAIATLFVTYDYNISFFLIGIGLGTMFTLISTTSLIVYFRTYMIKETDN